MLEKSFDEFSLKEKFRFNMASSLQIKILNSVKGGRDKLEFE